MQELVEKLSTLLAHKSMTLVTAESCTGGAIAAAITRRAGASAIFERGFITYSNEAKHEQLGVPNETLITYGAVSAQAAEAMAKGALANSHATLAISVTGIAGPDGGSAEKLVGTVHFGYALKGGASGSIQELFENSTREQVQNSSVRAALNLLINILEEA